MSRINKIYDFFTNISDEDLNTLLEETKVYNNFGPIVKDYLAEVLNQNESVEFDSMIVECSNVNEYSKNVVSPFSCNYSNVESDYDMAA